MITTIFRFVLSLFISITMCPCSQAEGEELSLLEIYTLARETAPDLSQARYSVDLAEAQKDVATGRILPQVNLFGQWSDNKVVYDALTFNTTESYPGERYGIQVSQSLLNVSNGLEAKRLGIVVEQSQAELALAESNLLEELTSAYLSVLLADNELNVKATELRALDRQLEEATALFEKNLAAITDVLETQTRRDSTKADVILMTGRAAVAREELFAVVGERSVEPMSVLDQIALPPVSYSLDAAVEMALTNNPIVAVGQKALDAADRAVDREKGSWIPDVSLTYSFQHSDVGFDNLRSPPRDTSILSIGVTYPLFEGGAGSARLRGAWAEYYTASTRLQAIRRDVEAQVRAAWVSFGASEERILAAAQASKTASTMLDATQRAYKLGVAKTSDTLLALAQNTNAKREFDRAKLEHAMAWLRLQLASGEDPASLAPLLSEALHGTE
jgi:outer membrane protein